MSPDGKRRMLEVRAQVLAAIRGFFSGRGYLEVDTPLRLRVPAMEEHIDAISADGAWLRTSPELHLKRLLCDGFDAVFQIGPCFRAGERGARHLPEYCMLEWYRAGTDSERLVDETLALLRAVEAAAGCPRREGLDLQAPPRRLEVSACYREWAGWDPVTDFDADRFDVDMAEIIEPALARIIAPVVLSGFPVERAALARILPGPPPVADRWELYLAGLEIANAYGELTDPVEQRRRFEDCGRLRRTRGQTVYPLDEEFLAALARGLPPCAGIALGVDRLLMSLSGAQDIRDVVAFTEAGI